MTITVVKLAVTWRTALTVPVGVNAATAGVAACTALTLSSRPRIGSTPHFTTLRMLNGVGLNARGGEWKLAWILELLNAGRQLFGLRIRAIGAVHIFRSELLGLREFQ